jgi:anti-sigma B factor antagonist
LSERDTNYAQAFRLATRTERERTVVQLHGELDLGTVGAVERAVQELHAQAVRSVVLDLRELTFIDSSGLRLLLRLDADARANGFDFALVEGDGPVRRLLELTNLTDDFRRAQL